MSKENGETIRIATARASFKYNNQTYKFPHAVSWVINNPVENTRINSPQQQTNGIKSRTNLTASASAAGVLREVPKDILKIMHQIFDKNEDVTFTIFDVETGRQVVQRYSSIRQDPMNMSVSEGDDSFNVNVDFICSPKNQKNSFVEV